MIHVHVLTLEKQHSCPTTFTPQNPNALCMNTWPLKLPQCTVGKYAIHGVSGPWRVWELTLQIQAPDPEIRDVLLEGLGLRRRGTNTDDAPDPDQTNGTEILIHLPHFMTPM